MLYARKMDWKINDLFFDSDKRPMNFQGHIFLPYYRTTYSSAVVRGKENTFLFRFDSINEKQQKSGLDHGFFSCQYLWKHCWNCAFVQKFVKAFSFYVIKTYDLNNFIKNSSISKSKLGNFNCNASENHYWILIIISREARKKLQNMIT